MRPIGRGRHSHVRVGSGTGGRRDGGWRRRAASLAGRGRDPGAQPIAVSMRLRLERTMSCCAASRALICTAA